MLIIQKPMKTIQTIKILAEKKEKKDEVKDIEEFRTQIYKKLNKLFKEYNFKIDFNYKEK